jgi:hypothetical protein
LSRDASDELFDERFAPAVIWDEEPLDREIIVGEDCVYGDQKQMPILASMVWDSAV